MHLAASLHRLRRAPRAGRLAVAATLCGIGLLASSPAQAAAPGPLGSGVAQATDGAPTEVFSGTVIKIETIRAAKPKGKPRPAPTSRYTVQVRLVYSGSIRSSQVVVRTAGAASSCQRGALATNSLYLFSVPRRGGALVESSCNQVVQWTGARGRSYAQRFPDAHAPVASPTQPTPADVTLQDRSVSTPMSFTRLAVPGAAAVLIGLLGLLVVRRLGRPAH